MGINDRMTVEDYKEIIEDIRNYVYVECGILNGDQLDIAKYAFVYCMGIELSVDYAYRCIRRFDKDMNVSITQCSSIEFLQDYIPETFMPTFFLLDSHYCKTQDGEPDIEKTDFTLWKELQLIKENNLPDIVAVDDIHTFGKNRKGAPYWKEVTRETILAFLGDRVERSKDYKDTFIVWLK